MELCLKKKISTEVLYIGLFKHCHDVVPENDDAWSEILDLKDTVELLASSTFSDKSLC